MRSGERFESQAVGAASAGSPAAAAVRRKRRLRVNHVLPLVSAAAGVRHWMRFRRLPPMPPRLAAVLTAFAVVASATASTVGSIERFDWSRRQMRSSGT